MIKEVKAQIDTHYTVNNPDAVIPYLEQLKDEVGGELYISTAQGETKGYGAGRGRNAAIQNKSQQFISDGHITEYTYTNKVGLDIYVLGIAVNEEYLVYEVSIQSLDDAVSVILEFFWVLLIVVMFVALIISVFLSRNIASPIKALNHLAKEMRTKEVKAMMVTKSQDEISELNQSLNELYDELLTTIYNLETELKKERNSERLKKRFLAQATHELKTPISVIKGYAEIVYDGMYKTEEERDRFLKNIYDECEAISLLILDVLDYTKMETGNDRLDMTEVNVKTFFGELAERYKGFIESKGLKAEIAVDLSADKVQRVDSRRIEQVFRNLISNAVEHSQTKVKVSVDEIGEKVRLTVINDGAQIDSEDLPYLFDSFYKKKGKQTGTGLGLAIVKEIVLLHGGGYRAENLVDGVQFTITI